MASLPSNIVANDHSDLLGAEVVDSILLIPTRDIVRGERLREIDPVWAGALGQLMARDGQHTPIEVCRLPGRSDWLLVAGGHRHEAAVLEEIEHLRAIVVSANRDDRRLREVNENLWRRDLDPIDRAAFIAEAVAIQKRRAGVDPAKDGRSLSIAVRWQKQVVDEAIDTKDTMSFVYGFNDEVAAELGLSAKTVQRDLLLYRRLAPSLIARLRGARHAILSNATQLRSLAKLEPRVQGEIVDALVGVNGWQPCRTVAEAVKRTQPGTSRVTFVDPEAKHLSAFLGAFGRMSVAARKGALAHLADQMPAGFRVVEGEEKPAATPFPSEHEHYRDEALELIDRVRDLIDGLEEDGAIPGDRGRDLYQAGRRLQLTRMSIARNAFALHAPDEASPSGSGSALLDAIAVIEQLLDDGRDPDWIVGEMTRRFDAKSRFAHGTYELRMHGVIATCTAGAVRLLRGWVAAARRKVAA